MGCDLVLQVFNIKVVLTDQSKVFFAGQVKLLEQSVQLAFGQGSIPILNAGQGRSLTNAFRQAPPVTSSFPFFSF